MVERDEASPKLGIPNPSRSGNRILGAAPAASNNRNQGKCLGTKPGALHALARNAGNLADIAQSFYVTIFNFGIGIGGAPGGAVSSLWGASDLSIGAGVTWP